MRIIVLFNLRADADPADYEAWARARDLPSVRALPSVDDFTIHRATGLLGQPGAKAPFDYVEVLDIADMDGFWTDVASSTSQAVAAEFRGWLAGELVFITTDELGLA